MNTTTRHLLVVATFAVLATVAPAQLLNNTTNTATTVRPIPPTPPPAIPAATAQGAASASTALRLPATPPAGATAAAAAQTSAGGQAAGISLAQGASHEAALAVKPVDTLRAIQSTAFAARATLSAEVEARLEAGNQAIARFQARAEQAGERARDDFGRAMREVRAREKELRASLKAAVQATKESTWGEVQATLARDYSAYAEAVAHAEASAGGSVKAGEEPKS